MGKLEPLKFSFVPMPAEIWSENLDLSLSEFRLLGYLLKQVRFGESLKPLSDDELLLGRLGPNGQRLDKGCGLTSRNGIKQAREALKEREWIEASNASDDPTRPKWLYRLSFKDDVTEGQLVSQNDTTLSRNDTMVSQNDTCNKEEERTKEETNTRNTSLFPETEDQTQKEPKGKTKVKKPVLFELPPWMPIDIWDAYLEMRQKIRKPLTETGKVLAVKEIHRLWKENPNNTPDRVLSQSIMNSWQGLFPVKGDTSNGRSKDADRTNRNRAILLRNIHPVSGEDAGHDVPALPDRVD